MTNFNEQFHTLAHDVRLTEAERRRIHTALRAAAAPRATPSPFFANPYALRFAYALAVLVILVGAGGGAAYASEDALPGDVLYPVKVAVTEPVIGAFASTPEAKLAWNAKVAETRLDEATALAAKGTLTATTSEELAANFNAHADAIPSNDTRFKALIAAKSGNVLAAGKESGNASSTLASGRLVLAIAERRAPAMMEAPASSAAPAVSVMRAPMNDQLAPADGASEEARPMMLMAPMMKTAFAPSAPPDDDMLAETLSVEAHAALDDATTTAAALGDDSVSDDLAAQLSDLSALVVKAEAERTVGSTTEAIADFKESLRLAAQIELVLSGGTPADESDDVREDDTLTPYPL
jgi:hypothetical protein